MKKDFPAKAVVACQGVQGSNSEAACRALIPEAEIMFMSSFDAVFTAVEKGLCEYGIFPVENSIHGSVTDVYDLMKRHRFRIVRAVRLRIAHALLAKPDAKIHEITEIISHPQALAQCSVYLKTLKSVKLTPAENTAASARYVSESGRRDIAAIASPSCADLYGLNILKSGIQNAGSNQTRFICISGSERNFPDADKMSIMFTLPNIPNALCSVLTEFARLDINLTKIESRPLGSDFEFMFYLDFEASLSDTRVAGLIAKLERELEYFSFLGNYHEIQTET